MRNATRALLLMLPLVAGCPEKGIGLPCLVTPIFCETTKDCPAGFTCVSANGTCVEEKGASSTRYTTDALECPSAICLQMLGSEVAACSERCENNNDCAKSENSTCRNPETGETTGFVCVQPIPIQAELEVGCDYLCVCRWDAERQNPPLFSSDGGVAISPQACDTGSAK